MEIEKITVKVELDGVVVHAVAVLTDRESRTKEGAAGAAAALCASIQGALRDGVDAGVLVNTQNGHGGHQLNGGALFGPEPARTPSPGPRPIPDHFCIEHEVEFKRQENERGHWYSHQLDAGGFCKEGRR